MRFKRVSAGMFALALAGCGGGEPSAPATDSPAPAQSSPEATAVPAGPRETPSAVPAEYVAHGNEPFWNVETHSGRIVYSSPEKLDGVTLEASTSQVEGWARFEARMDGAPLILEVRKGQCVDGMSGFEFSHQARLTRFDGIWTGCARLASEPQPRE